MREDDSIDLSAAHFTPFMCGMGEILSPKWVQTMPIIGPQNAQYCARNTRQTCPKLPYYLTRTGPNISTFCVCASLKDSTVAGEINQ